jgi:hypothetical protein
MTNSVRQLLSRIADANAPFGYEPLPAASSEQIQSMQNDLLAEFGVFVPAEFVEVLETTNGFQWNGAYFCSTHPVPYRPNGNVLTPSVLNETAAHWDWLAAVVLGHDEDQVFCYRPSPRGYFAIVTGTTSPIALFLDLEGLLHHVFENRLD